MRVVANHLSFRLMIIMKTKLWIKKQTNDFPNKTCTLCRIVLFNSSKLPDLYSTSDHMWLFCSPRVRCHPKLPLISPKTNDKFRVARFRKKLHFRPKLSNDQVQFHTTCYTRTWRGGLTNMKCGILRNCNCRAIWWNTQRGNRHFSVLCNLFVLWCDISVFQYRR